MSTFFYTMLMPEFFPVEGQVLFPEYFSSFNNINLELNFDYPKVYKETQINLVPDFQFYYNLRYSYVTSRACLYPSEMLLNSPDVYASILPRTFRKHWSVSLYGLYMQPERFFIGSDVFHVNVHAFTQRIRRGYFLPHMVVNDRLLYYNMFLFDYFSNIYSFDMYNDSCNYYFVDNVWTRMRPYKSVFSRLQGVSRRRFFTNASLYRISPFYDKIFPWFSNPHGFTNSVYNYKLHHFLSVYNKELSNYFEINNPNIVSAFVDRNFDRVAMKSTVAADFNFFGTTDRFVLGHRLQMPSVNRVKRVWGKHRYVFPSLNQTDWYWTFDRKRSYLTKPVLYEYYRSVNFFRGWRYMTPLQRGFARTQYNLFNRFRKIHAIYFIYFSKPEIMYWGFRRQSILSYHLHSFRFGSLPHSIGLFFPLKSFFSFNSNLFDWSSILLNPSYVKFLYHQGFKFYFIFYFIVLVPFFMLSFGLRYYENWSFFYFIFRFIMFCMQYVFPKRVSDFIRYYFLSRIKERVYRRFCIIMPWLIFFKEVERYKNLHGFKSIFKIIYSDDIEKGNWRNFVWRFFEYQFTKGPNVFNKIRNATDLDSYESIDFSYDGYFDNKFIQVLTLFLFPFIFFIADDLYELFFFLGDYPSTKKYNAFSFAFKAYSYLYMRHIRFQENYFFPLRVMCYSFFFFWIPSWRLIDFFFNLFSLEFFVVNEIINPELEKARLLSITNFKIGVSKFSFFVKTLKSFIYAKFGFGYFLLFLSHVLSYVFLGFKPFFVFLLSFFNYFRLQKFFRSNFFSYFTIFYWNFIAYSFMTDILPYRVTGYRTPPWTYDIEEVEAVDFWIDLKMRRVIYSDFIMKIYQTLFVDEFAGFGGYFYWPFMRQWENNSRLHLWKSSKNLLFLPKTTLDKDTLFSVLWFSTLNWYDHLPHWFDKVNTSNFSDINFVPDEIILGASIWTGYDILTEYQDSFFKKIFESHVTSLISDSYYHSYFFPRRMYYSDFFDYDSEERWFRFFNSFCFHQRLGFSSFVILFYYLGFICFFLFFFVFRLILKLFVKNYIFSKFFYIWKFLFFFFFNFLNSVLLFVFKNSRSFLKWFLEVILFVNLYRVFCFFKKFIPFYLAFMFGIFLRFFYFLLRFFSFFFKLRFIVFIIGFFFLFNIGFFQSLTLLYYDVVSSMFSTRAFYVTNLYNNLPFMKHCYNGVKESGLDELYKHLYDNLWFIYDNVLSNWRTAEYNKLLYILQSTNSLGEFYGFYYYRLLDLHFVAEFLENLRFMKETCSIYFFRSLNCTFIPVNFFILGLGYDWKGLLLENIIHYCLIAFYYGLFILYHWFCILNISAIFSVVIASNFNFLLYFGLAFYDFNFYDFIIFFHSLQDFLLSPSFFFWVALIIKKYLFYYSLFDVSFYSFALWLKSFLLLDLFKPVFSLYIVPFFVYYIHIFSDWFYFNIALDDHMVFGRFISDCFRTRLVTLTAAIGDYFTYFHDRYTPPVPVPVLSSFGDYIMLPKIQSFFYSFFVAPTVVYMFTTFFVFTIFFFFFKFFFRNAFSLFFFGTFVNDTNNFQLWSELQDDFRKYDWAFYDIRVWRLYFLLYFQRHLTLSEIEEYTTRFIYPSLRGERRVSHLLASNAFSDALKEDPFYSEDYLYFHTLAGFVFSKNFTNVDSLMEELRHNHSDRYNAFFESYFFFVRNLFEFRVLEDDFSPTKIPLKKDGSISNFYLWFSKFFTSLDIKIFAWNKKRMERLRAKAHPYVSEDFVESYFLNKGLLSNRKRLFDFPEFSLSTDTVSLLFDRQVFESDYKDYQYGPNQNAPTFDWRFKDPDLFSGHEKNISYFNKQFFIWQFFDDITKEDILAWEFYLPFDNNDLDFSFYAFFNNLEFSWFNYFSGIDKTWFNNKLSPSFFHKDPSFFYYKRFYKDFAFYWEMPFGTSNVFFVWFLCSFVFYCSFATDALVVHNLTWEWHFAWHAYELFFWTRCVSFYVNFLDFFGVFQPFYDFILFNHINDHYFYSLIYHRWIDPLYIEGTAEIDEMANNLIIYDWIATPNMFYFAYLYPEFFSDLLMDFIVDDPVGLWLSDWSMTPWEMRGDFLPYLKSFFDSIRVIAPHSYIWDIFLYLNEVSFLQWQDDPAVSLYLNTISAYFSIIPYSLPISFEVCCFNFCMVFFCILSFIRYFSGHISFFLKFSFLFQFLLSSLHGFLSLFCNFEFIDYDKVKKIFLKDPSILTKDSFIRFFSYYSLKSKWTRKFIFKKKF